MGRHGETPDIMGTGGDARVVAAIRSHVADALGRRSVVRSWVLLVALAATLAVAAVLMLARTHDQDAASGTADEAGRTTRDLGVPSDQTGGFIATVQRAIRQTQATAGATATPGASTIRGARTTTRTTRRRRTHSSRPHRRTTTTTPTPGSHTGTNGTGNGTTPGSGGNGNGNGVSVGPGAGVGVGSSNGNGNGNGNGGGNGGSAVTVDAPLVGSVTVDPGTGTGNAVGALNGNGNGPTKSAIEIVGLSVQVG